MNASPESGGFHSVQRGTLAAEILVVALLTARFWVPAEGASEGTTLIAAWLGLVTTGLWLVCCPMPLSAGREVWLSRGVYGLIGGHLIGGLLVFLSGGDRRVAANLMIEWASLGAFWFLLQRAVVTARGRGTLLVVLNVAGIGLACIGLQQHFSEFPRLAAEYQARIEPEKLARELVASGRTTPDALVKVERELAELGVPSDPGARMLWEHRLLHSREPLAFFALANSLAGVLLVALLLGAGRLLVEWLERPRDWLRCLLGILGLLLLALCFLLTKSRTAWAGALVGVGLFLTGLYRQHAGAILTRRLWIGVGGVAAVGCLLVALLGATGGLDPLVLLEATKSIRYRAEYWGGSLAMLTSSPQLLIGGTGLGQFRNEYLPFKFASSSEEIADPHNLFLDAWANGGLLALIGLVVIVARLLVTLLRGDVAVDSGRGDVPRLPWTGLAGLSGGLILALVMDGGTDDRILLVGAVTVVWLGVVSVLRCEGALAVTVLPASLGLCVHLLGAGGIGMPAISGTWLALLALLTSSGKERPVDSAKYAGSRAETEATSPVALRSVVAGRVAGVLLGVISVMTLIWGVLPALSSSSLLGEADAAYYVRKNLDEAIRLTEQAAQVDPWRPETYEKLGHWHLVRWRALVADTENDKPPFDLAIAALEASVAREPHSSGRMQLVGLAWQERWRKTHSPDDARSAADWFRRALRRYPNDARLAVDFAEVAPPDEARDAARRALELDLVAEQYGHTDKRLSQPRRELAERLAQSPG